MKHWVTKKNILIGAMVGLACASIIIFQENINLCTLVDGKYYRNCLFNDWTQTSIAAPLFGLSLVILLLTLITYKLREEIFHTWLKFSAFAIPAMLFFIMMSPESAMGGFIASAMTVTRAEAALQLSVIYLLISLFVITLKWFTLQGGKR